MAQFTDAQIEKFRLCPELYTEMCELYETNAKIQQVEAEIAQEMKQAVTAMLELQIKQGQDFL